jgi:1-deoxy-D-xylulose-5-phosphate synthase
MDMMAGLAKTGFKPFFAVYSTFLQRAFDQAFQEVALQGLPSGSASTARAWSAATAPSTTGSATSPCSARSPTRPSRGDRRAQPARGARVHAHLRRGPLGRPLPARRRLAPLRQGRLPPFELGKARLLTPEHADLSANRPDVAVLAFGTPAIDAMAAKDDLGAEYNVAVYDARFAKPVDDALIRDLLSRNIPSSPSRTTRSSAGFGPRSSSPPRRQGLDASRVTVLGLPDEWIIQDSRAAQLAKTGIDAAGIARAIRAASESAPGTPAGTPDTPAHA